MLIGCTVLVKEILAVVKCKSDKCSSFYLLFFLFSSDNDKLLKAVIVAGLYPKVAMIKPSHSKHKP